MLTVAFGLKALGFCRYFNNSALAPKAGYFSQNTCAKSLAFGSLIDFGTWSVCLTSVFCKSLSEIGSADLPSLGSSTVSSVSVFAATSSSVLAVCSTSVFWSCEVSAFFSPHATNPQTKIEQQTIIIFLIIYGLFMVSFLFCKNIEKLPNFQISTPQTYKNNMETRMVKL